jgi:hypothetical protein
MQTYTHLGLADVAGALNSLPALPGKVRTRFVQPGVAEDRNVSASAEKEQGKEAS